MDIVNIEKLNGHKTIVLTGHNKDVVKIARNLKARLYHVPREEDYFMDYPMVVNELQDTLFYEQGIVIITTQSAEFLDCLLTSNLNFMSATVRKYDHDDVDTYRLRVLTKEEAWENRRDFNMELRI